MAKVTPAARRLPGPQKSILDLFGDGFLLLKFFDLHETGSTSAH
jgi:hypothetical protein